LCPDHCAQQYCGRNTAKNKAEIDLLIRQTIVIARIDGVHWTGETREIFTARQCKVQHMYVIICKKTTKDTQIITW